MTILAIVLAFAGVGLFIAYKGTEVECLRAWEDYRDMRHKCLELSKEIDELKRTIDELNGYED